MDDPTTYEVRHSSVHGRGVFVHVAVPKGTRVGEYCGKRISEQEALLLEGYDPNNPFHTFLFVLNDGTIVDGGNGGSDARWINHSCDPNCKAIEELGAVYLIAICDIEAGTELNYDYGLILPDEQTPALKYAHRCCCGATNCRGTMLGDGKPITENRIRLLENDPFAILKKWDTTGTSAALATLLAGQHGRQVNERAIFYTLWEIHAAEPARIEKGFSFLEIKRYVERLGLTAVAYANLRIAQLLRLGPAMIKVDFGNCSHFSVFRGARDGAALLADPVYGDISVDWANLEAAWQPRAALVISEAQSD